MFESGMHLQGQIPEYACFEVLDQDGNLRPDREPALASDDLLGLYRAMVLARAVDERMLKLQRQGRIGTFPLSSGQEAAACGPTLAMKKEDWYAGSFRELGGRLMRGDPIENIFLCFGGYEEGNVFPGGERTLPISVIIASQTLHAVGIAYAMRMQGEKETAVVCFFGDGATSEGDFHEALNFAAVWQVPVVFVCLNNQWAISVPRHKQTRSRTIAQKGIAYEIPGVQVDGNDALAMYQVTKEALDRARAGGGPTLIEAITYRLKMHTTADDPSRYRSDEEVAEWERRDPIPRFQKFLVSQGLWNDAQQAELEADVGRKIDEAVAKYESIADLKDDTPFDNVFENPHPRIESQRAEFLSEIEKEKADG
ncbi:MAG: pyruvate dehydrogenase (acetyl-transferring) E1 component subunit alpha [Planctomycetota bacterium]